MITIKAPYCIVLLLTLAAYNQPASAQQNNPILPACESVADDPDGDGFGWVVFTQSSCRVTDNTAPAPERINRETGQPVLLERAYWDANADLANRNLHCRQFEWNTNNSRYQSTTERWFRFIALPTQPPWIADYFSLSDSADLQNLSPETRLSLQWSVDFGIFYSNDFLFFQADFPAAHTRWVERFTSSDGQAGIRFWDKGPDQQEQDVVFSECFDISGEAFGPTGRSDQPATNLPPAYLDTPLYFSGATEPLPAITHRQTGQAVQFETGYWEFQSDLSHRTLRCAHIEWDENTGDYHQARFNQGFTDYITFHPRLATSAVNEGRALLTFDGRNFVERWRVAGENFSGPGRFANSMWYEPIESEQGAERLVVQGVRYWGRPEDTAEERSNYYIDCYATERSSRGLASQTRLVNSLRPGQNTPPPVAPPPDATPPATDTPDNQNTDAPQPDNSEDESINPDTTQNEVNPLNPGTTPDEDTPENPDTTLTVTNFPASEGGGGGFSLLLLSLLAVLGKANRHGQWRLGRHGRKHASLPDTTQNPQFD